jgi:hypothetical protein
MSSIVTLPKFKLPLAMWVIFDGNLVASDCLHFDPDKPFFRDKLFDVTAELIEFFNNSVAIENPSPNTLHRIITDLSLTPIIKRMEVEVKHPGVQKALRERAFRCKTLDAHGNFVYYMDDAIQSTAMQHLYSEKFTGPSLSEDALRMIRYDPAIECLLPKIYANYWNDKQFKQAIKVRRYTFNHAYIC